MATVYRVELTYKSDEWRRGRAKDIADRFETAEPEEGRPGSVIITYEIPKEGAGFMYTQGEWEAYRLARNRADSRMEAEGLYPTFQTADIEEVEPEREEIPENPTIDDADNWVVWDEGDQFDWYHEPTNQTLAIKKDGPNVREDWHSDTWHDKSPWVISHKFTTIGRYETEEEARESALEWMVGNPYGLNPRDSYM